MQFSYFLNSRSLTFREPSRPLHRTRQRSLAAPGTVDFKKRSKIQGVYDGQNCAYAPSFVDAGNNLLVDMTVPALPNGGAHIFQGSLFVGKTYNTQAELTAAGITKGGDGPVLTVEAGAKLAFMSEKQFIIINRGSQIFAVGRADAPVTFTSVSDINRGAPSARGRRRR